MITWTAEASAPSGGTTMMPSSGSVANALIAGSISVLLRTAILDGDHPSAPVRRGGRRGDQRPLEGWATTINTSARTLARRFQSETGLSFGAWRQQARVLEAMGRLGGGAAVTEVAFDLGYESVSAFSAMFHRATGASPTQFRNRPQAQ